MFDSPDELASSERIDADGGPVLVCRVCGNRVARVSWIAPVQGGPARRVFFNPEGVMMQVVTLHATSNVRAVGVPTTEFSWFPGFAWAYAQCGDCGRQLGWRFTPMGEPAAPAFWALLESAVREEEE